MMYALPIVALTVLSAVDAEIVPVAIRVCQPSVSSEIARANTELEAKKLALDEWKKKALTYGSNHDGWQLAAEKSLKCFPKDGAFECVAFGSPCIVQQNPKQKPAGKDGKGQDL